MKEEEMSIKEIDIELIKDSPYQTRENYELERIHIDNGIVQKPVVYDLQDGTYEIKIGHRRIEKAKEKNWNKVECVVIPKEPIHKTLLDQAKENYQHKSENPYEQAKRFKQMLEHDIAMDTIANELKVSKRYIQYRLQFLKDLPLDVAKQIKNKSNSKYAKYENLHRLTFSKARLLLDEHLKDDTKRFIVNIITTKGLTIKELEKRLRRYWKFERWINILYQEPYRLPLEELRKFDNEIEGDILLGNLKELRDLKDRAIERFPQIAFYCEERINRFAMQREFLKILKKLEEFSEKYPDNIDLKVGEKTIEEYEKYRNYDIIIGCLMKATFRETKPNAECEICGRKLVMSGLNKGGEVYCKECFRRSVKGR